MGVLSSRRLLQEKEEQVVLRRESTRKYFLQKTSSLPLNSNSSYNSYSNCNISYNSSYNSNDDVNLCSQQQQFTGRRHQSVKLRPSRSSQQVNMVTPHQYFSSSTTNLPESVQKAPRKLSIKRLRLQRFRAESSERL